MKKMLMGSAAAIAMFFSLGAPARSADIVAEPAMTDWSGFYIGGHVGYGWANMSGCYDCEDDSSVLEAEDLDLEGIVAGLHAGYNWQMDNLVFGIEGDVSFVDMDDSDGSPEAVPSEVQSAEVDLLASIRARLGIALDDVLLYATGGIAFADAEWEANEVFIPDKDSVNFDDIGGVVGGGIEYAMTESFRLRAEGLYYFFDDEESIEDFPGANTGESIEFDDVFVVRGGVSFYFN
jgi:outer membrane immunogenic protein